MKKEKLIIEDLKEEENEKSEVEYITEENMKSHNIYDIAMPIIGSDTIIKAKPISEIYEQCLKEAGILLEDFKANSKYMLI